MKNAGVLAVTVAVVALAGCSQSQTSTQSEATPTVQKSKAAPTTASPVETSQAPTSAAPTSAAPTATQSAIPGDKAFCAYLKKTQGAQQIVEDPDQYVALVQGAAALAPGSIAEDAALYAESARQLALTVTGSAKEASKADKWLTANQAAVDQAEANLNSYAESTCGLPFIASGE